MYEYESELIWLINLYKSESNKIISLFNMMITSNVKLSDKSIISSILNEMKYSEYGNFDALQLLHTLPL